MALACCVLAGVAFACVGRSVGAKKMPSLVVLLLLLACSSENLIQGKLLPRAKNTRRLEMYVERKDGISRLAWLGWYSNSEAMVARLPHTHEHNEAAADK